MRIIKQEEKKFISDNIMVSYFLYETTVTTGNEKKSFYGIGLDQITDNNIESFCFKDLSLDRSLIENFYKLLVESNQTATAFLEIVDNFLATDYIYQ